MAERGVRLERLTRAQFLAIVAFSSTHFFVGHGPVWEYATDHRRLLPSIAWSYATIPVLVALALVWSRRLRFAPWAVSTLEVMATKFVLTAGIMTVVLVLRDPVAPATRSPDASSAAPVDTAPIPTPIDPSSTGILAGEVVDAQGRPVAAALVHVASGLGDLVFEAPAEALVLENDGTGFAPPSAVLRTWQPFVLHSTDGKLHTLRGVLPGGRAAFNYPALAAGSDELRVVREPFGRVVIECAVHGHATSERSAVLLVVDHPFHAFTDPEGAFAIEGVPAGSLEVWAWDGTRGEGRARVELVAGARTTVRIALEGHDEKP